MKPGSNVTVRPVKHLHGSLRLPGDKSISHRYAMLAAIAEGKSRFENYSTGADCASTLACLGSLGVHWERTNNGANVIEIDGRGPALAAPTSALDCGNSGSTMRMLSGILAGQEFTSDLCGDESLSRRPMARIMKPLEQMGAKITAAPEERPPLHIAGGNLHAIRYKMPVASAQVKSCLLFAGLFAKGETEVEEPLRTRDHGEVALRAFGADLKRSANSTCIVGGQRLHAIEARIPGDLSSAAFFFCAASLFPGSELVIDSLLMNPTRARLLDILIGLGVRISITQLEEQHGELVGTVRVEGAHLKSAEIAGADSAALIDEIPVLAAIAPFTEEGIRIRDAGELRVKESDRIQSIVTNLRAMGAQVDEHDDGLTVPGGQKLHGAEINSAGDHRIAMAFAIAALRAEGETRIHGAEAAVISFPSFFETLESLVQR
jgi:3-phosphoshikimate 1-carboxyvinyltransferase